MLNIYVQWWIRFEYVSSSLGLRAKLPKMKKISWYEIRLQMSVSWTESNSGSCIWEMVTSGSEFKCKQGKGPMWWGFGQNQLATDDLEVLSCRCWTRRWWTLSMMIILSNWRRIHQSFQAWCNNSPCYWMNLKLNQNTLTSKVAFGINIDIL
jgi:hypothetical protein